MKQSPRPSARTPSRLGQALQALQQLFRGWLPQPAPVLVPIPIRADRRASPSTRRLYDRGG